MWCTVARRQSSAQNHSVHQHTTASERKTQSACQILIVVWHEVPSCLGALQPHITDASLVSHQSFSLSTTYSVSTYYTWQRNVSSDRRRRRQQHNDWYMRGTKRVCLLQLAGNQPEYGSTWRESRRLATTLQSKINQSADDKQHVCARMLTMAEEPEQHLLVVLHVHLKQRLISVPYSSQM